MLLKHLLTLNSVAIDSFSLSKTAVLRKVSALLSENFPELNKEELFAAYWKRECLGSTAIGHGIVIPHVRVAGLLKPHACFIRLMHPVDFGAEDKQPAELVIGLAVPEDQVNQHLKLLREIISQFSSAAFRQQCCSVSCAQKLFELL